MTRLTPSGLLNNGKTKPMDVTVRAHWTSPAQAVCRTIAAGAVTTGTMMVLFSQDVQATSSNTLVSSVVHVSNVKFMAAMWCVTGVIFALGASQLHEPAAWRLLRVACIGISAAALVRLIEMMRLDAYSTFGIAAALTELVVPPILILLRRKEHRETRP